MVDKSSPVIVLRCKHSKDCDRSNKEVCDRKEHICRPSKIQPVKTMITLAKECLQKGIPITYERGEKKGQRKTREAMRNCQNQKDRNVVISEKKPMIERETPQRAQLRRKMDTIISSAFENLQTPRRMGKK